MQSPSRLVAALFASSSLATAQPPARGAWETCSITERKGDSCQPGDVPRPFNDFLVPGPWAEVRDSFVGDSQFDIEQPDPFQVTWRQAGAWGSHRIRRITYSRKGLPFADLIVAEHGPGRYSPLMKWSGGMPRERIYQHARGKILVLEKDFGGNVPMVQTWAWMWRSGGPVRLNDQAAIRQAFDRVAPGYQGYATGLDWRDLHLRTWVWKGEWRGKIGVADTLEAWFALGPNGLVLKRAEFQDETSDKPHEVSLPAEP